MLTRGIGPSVPSGEERVDPLAYLFLDKAAAAGSDLEFVGNAQVLGAALAEQADCLNAGAGAMRSIVKIGQYARHRGKQWALCQPLQFRDCLGQAGSRACYPRAVDSRAVQAP
jgi:hypothetical protein